MPTETRTRYPGLASFTIEQRDLFFGRKQETRDLFNLISVERTVVLFSKSGYGKTSLLQAGVMPLLYGQWLVPVPVRFGTDRLTPEQHFSIQLDTAWHEFAGKTQEEAQKAARDTSATETFWGQIARSPFGEPPAQFTPLFIFDQFEELFTLTPTPRSASASWASWPTSSTSGCPPPCANRWRATSTRASSPTPGPRGSKKRRRCASSSPSAATCCTSWTN